MKKQLLALSAIFVVFAAQASFYEQMKAKAQQMTAAAKEKLMAAKQTIQANMPAIQGVVKENLPAVQEFVKTNVLPTAQQLVTEKVIVGEGGKGVLDNLAKSVPGGEQALSKMKDLYMQQFHPTFEKQVDPTTGEVQWVDKSQATSVAPMQ